MFVGGGECRNLLHHHVEPWSVFLTADFSLLIKEWACQASGWTMGGDVPEKREGADVYSDQLLFSVYSYYFQCSALCVILTIMLQVGIIISDLELSKSRLKENKWLVTRQPNNLKPGLWLLTLSL